MSNPESDYSRIAEIKVSYSSIVPDSDIPVVQTSNEAYKVLLEAWDKSTIELQEQFRVIFLNRANKVLGIFHLSTGGITGTVADPRIILAAAIKTASCSIILAHNHPSGNLRPSRADEELTEKIIQASSYFDIKVLDHLIISKQGYFSFADEGIV